MALNEKKITLVYDFLTHRCDGPVTSFVILERACEVSHRGFAWDRGDKVEVTPEEVANACCNALHDYHDIVIE